MKLYTFEINQQRRIGAEWEGQVIDLPAAYNAWLASHGPKTGALRVLPSEMLSFIRLGTLALEAARETIQFVKKRPAVPVGEELSYPLNQVKILSPIPRPGKILGCEGNFPAHPNAAGSMTIPEEPVFFSKVPSTVVGPGDPIIKPELAEQLQGGVVLAVVMGKKVRNIPEEEVASSIFGYTILNDVSAHEARWKERQLILRKNCDSFCPLGPCIVTADEMENPAAAGLRATFDGKLLQEANTAQWLFSLPRLVSFLSRALTLEPGDIVGTGSPPALGISPLLKMSEGNEAVVEIEGIGRLVNPITKD